MSSRRRAVDHRDLSFRGPAAPPATRRSTSQRRTARRPSKQTVRVDSGGLAGCSLIFNLCSLRSVGLRANLNNFVQLGDGSPRGSLTLTVGSRLWCLPPRPPLQEVLCCKETSLRFRDGSEYSQRCKRFIVRKYSHRLIEQIIRAALSTTSNTATPSR